MSVIKLPLNKTWKDARDAREKLYNNPAWYANESVVRDRILQEWNRLTHIMRQEENKADLNSRAKYRLPTGV